VLLNAGCDFDKPCSNWDSTYWTISSISSPSINTGPISDHTGNGGNYAYISSSGQDGEKFRLRSISLPPTQTFSSLAANYERGVCLQFWYHMYGPEIGSLNLYVETANQLKLRWRKSGTQVNRWKYASVYIDTIFDFNVIFEAVTTGGRLGDIALDDIQVSFFIRVSFSLLSILFLLWLSS
jgi:hypothetical protein